MIFVDMEGILGEPIISLREASRKLGRNRKLIGYLVAMHDVPTRPMPSCGRARGLDRKALDKLLKLLEVYDRRVNSN